MINKEKELIILIPKSLKIFSLGHAFLITLCCLDILPEDYTKQLNDYLNIFQKISESKSLNPYEKCLLSLIDNFLKEIFKLILSDYVKITIKYDMLNHISDFINTVDSYYTLADLTGINKKEINVEDFMLFEITQDDLI